MEMRLRKFPINSILLLVNSYSHYSFLFILLFLLKTIIDILWRSDEAKNDLNIQSFIIAESTSTPGMPWDNHDFRLSLN